ncbi:hypothetical protein EXIGLDRAFT_774442 [Exidia glandulosa HHB12029]|uniref:F-box domain-containing protein n=1 Tax=Exidia glandulosa HHB12029 TaxID=1314781 RepID=A0A165ECU8_EXIGL|nr:hypothetical protein EXIGLDRAFT_774442 [Exidia glandulosa HHB12029]
MRLGQASSPYHSSARAMPVPTMLRRASSKAIVSSSSTKQQSPAGQLPPEVLLMVLAHIRTPADALDGDEIPRVDRALAGAPRICRAWAAAATHELYHDVTLPDLEACTFFLRTLKASPAIGARVRRVSLPLCSTSRCASSASVRTKHRTANCAAMNLFSEILRRLPGVRAVRVQDMHVSDATLAGSLSRVEELVIDNRYSACAVVHPAYPQLLYAGHCMRRVRALTLLGSPWGMPAPLRGAQYHFPSLRALRMRAVDAPLADIRGLLHSTRNTLHALDVDTVRAYSGRCAVAGVAHIGDILAPVSDTLQQLRVAGIARRGGIQNMQRLRHLDLDVQDDLANIILPPNLRSVKISATKQPLLDECAEDSTRQADPWHTGQAIWTMLARGSAPDLDSIALRADASSREDLRSWRLAALLLEKTCAHADLRFTARIELARIPPSATAYSERGQDKSDWANRKVFEPMRKLLKRTVTV